LLQALITNKMKSKSKFVSNSSLKPVIKKTNFKPFMMKMQILCLL